MDYNKRPNLYKQARGEFYNAIEQTRESSDIWAEFDTFDKEGDFDYSGFSGYSGEASRYDSVSKKSSTGYAARSSEGSKEYYHSAREVEDLVSALKEKFASPIEAKESGEVNDAHFSIEFAEDIAENQRAYVERGNGGGLPARSQRGYA